MVRIVFAVFLILHGLVHLLYFGQSQRLFELRPGMVWPNGSWVFSRFAGDEATRLLASMGCILAALGFVIGGAGILLEQRWWQAAVIGTAVLSSLLYILFWDGGLQQLDDKGAVGLLISVAVLVVVLMLESPFVAF